MLARLTLPRATIVAAALMTAAGLPMTGAASAPPVAGVAHAGYPTTPNAGDAADVQPDASEATRTAQGCARVRGKYRGRKHSLSIRGWVLTDRRGVAHELTLIDAEGKVVDTQIVVPGSGKYQYPRFDDFSCDGAPHSIAVTVEGCPQREREVKGRCKG